MKINTIIKITGAFFALVTIQASAQPQSHGMPAEMRDTIHGLFDSHNKFQREIVQTEEGYHSKTTSDDSAAVALLQGHVKQMERRLKDGLMVRAWDPAYVEFVNHYDDIDIQITSIENGISIVAIGKTEDAKKVARNHAGIISKFIDEGWAEHDKTHATVVPLTSPKNTNRAMGGPNRRACCQMEEKETSKALGNRDSAAANRESCPTDSEGGKDMSCCRKNI